MKLPVYLDNHATTPLDPRVLEAMLPYFTEHFGNASSRAHEYGWMAAAAVDVARGQVARLIGCQSNEIVFTSGATESINLAIKGVVEGYQRRGIKRPAHVVTVSTEHHAVLDTCKALESTGVRHTMLPVDRFGQIDPEALAHAIDGDTLLVSVMWANNEIGTITRMDVISGICRQRGVLLHSDATQAIGKIPVDVRSIPVDLLSFSAHKMYGPKGIGALFVRQGGSRFRLVPQIDGGGHEGGMRSGTLNVPAIVGFGRAAQLSQTEWDEESKRTSRLRDLLETEIREGLPEILINGHPVERLCNNSSITFPGRRADAMIMAMKDIAVSTGSACSSARPEPSHVLQAIGHTIVESKATVRFGLGRFTTQDEVMYAARRVIEAARLSLPGVEEYHPEYQGTR
jgi:cysteine desulfurase